MSIYRSHPALYGTGYAHTEHFVPEGWEDLERGICPCGEVVIWHERIERWRPRRSMKVLVLTAEEAAIVKQAVDDLQAGDEDAKRENVELQRRLKLMLALSADDV